MLINKNKYLKFNDDLSLNPSYTYYVIGIIIIANDVLHIFIMYYLLCYAVLYCLRTRIQFYV
jgi:hypothetical protein